MSNEELFILQRMIKGDLDAFKYFFDTYYDDLCNFVNIYLHNESVSEDIVQNIFIFLWENKYTLPSNCSIRSYLYTASKNKSLNYLRNLRNKNRIIGTLLSQPDFTYDYPADRFLEFEELKKIICDAVERLPAQCKKIFQMSRDDDLTNREIAEKLGITVKTVENQITIAIKKIKGSIKPYYDKIFILMLINIFYLL